jgi:DUF4097 and DUF4098 domain-containing protein YvlB
MQNFDTPAPIATVLNIPAGRLQFIAADRTDTAVEIRPVDASKSRDVKAAEQTTVQFADGVLRIDGPPANRLFGNSGSVEVTVQLPAGSRVEAKAAAGDFRGVGRLGEVTLEAAAGTIKLDEATSVRITTQAGDVTVGRLGGSAEISTQQGDITIAEAVSGSVVLRTTVGDVTVDARAGVSASLDAGTTVGRIHNSLKNADGAADLNIHATTTAGDITARSL